MWWIWAAMPDSTIVMQKIDPPRWHRRSKSMPTDSFEGLPELTENDSKDGVYSKGYMAAGLELFTQKFNALGLKMPAYPQGLVRGNGASQLPDRISFALLDGRILRSTKHLLPHVYERMAPGAIGMIACMQWGKIYPRTDLAGGYRSPGVKRATDRVLQGQAREGACALCERGFLQRVFPQTLTVGPRCSFQGCGLSWPL